MVLGVVSSNGDVMPPHFFEQGLRVNADGYIHVLETVVKPWMDLVANGSPYVFQQDSAPAHKARRTQAWLYDNMPHHWSPDLWPPSSPDCNPLDYFVWGVVEREVDTVPYNTIGALRQAIVDAMGNIHKGTLVCACSHFCRCLEKLFKMRAATLNNLIE